VRQQRLDRAAELVGEIGSVGVAVGFRQRGKAREIGEEKGVFGVDHARFCM
jgi:hypothetical protein